MTEFHLDQFSAGFLAGWARGALDKPLVLNLSINGSISIIGKEAGIYRSDLHGAGIGSGCFGFCFILDEAMDNGSHVEITDSVSDEVLFLGEFRGEIHAGLRFALAAARALPILTQPYWQSMLVCNDQDVVLAGALCLPFGADPNDVDVVDADTALAVPLTVEPAHPSSENRLWFVPGDVYDARLSVTVQEGRQRLGLVSGSKPLSDTDLNFAVIPSKTDFTSFRFAGAERARRVAGSADTLHLFAAGGLTQATQILTISEGLYLPADARVLDWGCGAARVTQFVAADRPHWRVAAADIDEVNIRWCKEALGDSIEFSLLDLMPPTAYADAYFDFIYGLSVITHLEQAVRNAWIAELGRMVKPGGYVLLTYMGLWAALQCGRHDAAMDVYACLSSRGISDNLKDYALGDELSSYYKATYNTRSELFDELQKGFYVEGEYPRSLCYQDAVLLRKR